VSVSGDNPLSTRTPRAWAERALAEPLALLDDHAHLERKAASNALALLSAAPPCAASSWARVLAGIARDETEHLALVVRRLEARGGRLSREHRNPYAAALHGLARRAGTDAVLDRLLVCALIEARSCERFEVLEEAGADPDLRSLHGGLAASERGHHKAFLALARDVAPEGEVSERWAWFVEREAETIAAQRPGARMHAGPA
jgi:tRNA-(ms[2]io[6]A)-hydroxylase